VNWVDPYGLDSLGQQISKGIQWQIRSGGLLEGTGRPFTIEPPSPIVSKLTAFTIGLGVGSLTGPAGAVFTYWAVDSFRSLLRDEPIGDPKFGIELINPPNVHAPTSCLDY